MRFPVRWSVMAMGLATALIVGCGGSSGGGASGISPTEAKVAEPGAGQAAQDSGTSLLAEASGANSTSAAQANALSGPLTVIEPKVSDGGQGRDVDPFKNFAARVRPNAAVISLPTLPATEGGTLQKSVALSASIPLKVGVPRLLMQTSDKNATAALLNWQEGDGGAQFAALRFLSPGAKGVRLGVLVKSLPFGARIRFYADGADKYFEIPGQEMLSIIRRNIEAGDMSNAARTYWSPDLGGEAITMEIEIPVGVDTKSVDLSVPSLSHSTIDIRKLDYQKIGDAGSCNLDVPCTSNYNQLSQSVALMDFVADGTGGTTNGATYVCTGTLLNDRMSTGTPWFLSAKHCVPTQTVASTLYTLWFYRSASCNSGSINTGVQVLTTGATLLYVSPSAGSGLNMIGDTSFMRLNSTPPAGAMYAGSSPMGVPVATTVYDVHHPQGDVQKYSIGQMLSLADCREGPSCATSVTPNSRFLRVNWRSGTTEGGSSGSGLFMTLNGKDYLVGQLLGGSASCNNPAGSDYFGRFDLVYSEALQQWLNTASTTVRVPVYRFYNTRGKTHFYTATLAERDYVITKLSEYNYEGIGFYAYGMQAAETGPVYRFYNNKGSAHFYTNSEIERQQIINTLPWYGFDGVAWYAAPGQIGNSAPMYRFYNTSTETHFFTLSQAERDDVIARLAEYQYEGVAYFAWGAP